MPTRGTGRALELPLLGFVARGRTDRGRCRERDDCRPENVAGKRDSYVLRVKGDSMIDEQIRDGDFGSSSRIASRRSTARWCRARRRIDVTLKKFYRGERPRAPPARRNPAMQPLMVDADQAGQGVVVGVDEEILNYS